MRHASFSLILCVAVASCSDNGASTTDSGVDAATGDDAAASDSSVDGKTDGEASKGKVGFEILQIVSPNEIIVWLGRDLTLEQFSAIELPQGWFKNQPRETDPDGGSFARSPNASADGEFTDEEHFGHSWRHNATVIESNKPLDDQGLLRLNRIAKFHTVTFFAGRTLKVLISPDGDKYVRISRDAGRTSEEPTLPAGWELVDYTTPEELDIELPNPTDNIRGDNEDSFQGPVPQLPVGD
jgi:hypothetical protein